MSLFKNFLFARSEKHLASYRRKAAQTEEETKEEYRSYLPLLTDCYGRASYWHGTGRYHHQNPGDIRYSHTVAKKTIDVFGSILAEGGLSTHQDIGALIAKQYIKTISLAPSRMHARLYAHIHLREGVWLKYVFGGTKFWMYFFILLAIDHVWMQSRQGHLRGEDKRYLKRAVGSRALLHQGRVWASSVRDLSEFKILPLWRAYDLRSDIVGNHPVLLGIRKEAVSTDGSLPFLKKLEVRVPSSIGLEHITHIEVPKENVADVRAELAQKNISIPIIPLEFGELYCSHFSLQQLVHV